MTEGYVPFLMACVISGVLAFPIFRLLLALKSRQTVSQYVPEHAAKQGTPTMGGLIIAAGFIATACWLSTTIAPMIRERVVGEGEWSIPLLFIGFMLIGFADDFIVPRLMKGKRGLGWTQKLVLQIIFAVAAVLMARPEVSPAVMGVAVFLVLFFSNAYNFADGLDWLAGSLLLVMVLGYCALAEVSNGSPLTLYLLALAGATLPFMVLNRPPAKIFMGDVGALPIGAVFGYIIAAIGFPAINPVLHVIGFSKGGVMGFQTQVNPWVWVGLVLVSGMMIAELVPVPLQILSVKLRKKRIFLATPIHHGFQKKGWPESSVVKVFVTWQVAFSLLGALVGYLGVLGEDRARREEAIQHLGNMVPPERP